MTTAAKIPNIRLEDASITGSGKGTSMKLRLKSLDHDFCVEEFEKPAYILGRSSDCDFVIDGTGISRQHAEFEFNGDKWVLKDLNSASGVMVNDQRIQQPTILNGGEKIKLANEFFTVSINLTPADIEAFKEQFPYEDEVEEEEEEQDARRPMRRRERQAGRQEQTGRRRVRRKRKPAEPPPPPTMEERAKDFLLQVREDRRREREEEERRAMGIDPEEEKRKEEEAKRSKRRERRRARTELRTRRPEMEDEQETPRGGKLKWVLIGLVVLLLGSGIFFYLNPPIFHLVKRNVMGLIGKDLDKPAPTERSTGETSEATPSEQSGTAPENATPQSEQPEADASAPVNPE